MLKCINMKCIRLFPFLIALPFCILACSTSADDNPVPVKDPGGSAGTPEVPVDNEYVLTLNDLGYSSTSNATLIVKGIDSFEGSEAQAYIQEGFLGLGGLPDRTIETSDSTRVYIDSDSMKVYVYYPNKNFTILGYNGIERQYVTENYTILGDNWVTPLRIDYALDDQNLSLNSISYALTYCGENPYYRSSSLKFDGSFDKDINGYDGSFTWTENGGEAGPECTITCKGTMALVLDE